MKKNTKKKQIKSGLLTDSKSNLSLIIPPVALSSSVDTDYQAYHYSCGLTFLEYGKYQLAINGSS